MYSDGLEIAGVGVGMVFLALVVILATTLILRTGIDWAQQWQGGRALAVASPAPETPAGFAPAVGPEPAKPPSERAARAAAIAVALFLAEEEEADRGEM